MPERIHNKSHWYRTSRFRSTPFRGYTVLRLTAQFPPSEVPEAYETMLPHSPPSELTVLIYDNNFLSYLKRYNIVTDLCLNNEFLHKINELLDNKIEFLSVNKCETNDVYEFVNSVPSNSFGSNGKKQSSFVSAAATLGIRP